MYTRNAKCIMFTVYPCMVYWCTTPKPMPSVGFDHTRSGVSRILVLGGGGWGGGGGGGGRGANVSTALYDLVI